MTGGWRCPPSPPRPGQIGQVGPSGPGQVGKALLFSPASRARLTALLGIFGPTMANMNTPPDRARVRLPGISSRAYEHPADRSALVAMRKLTGFDVLLQPAGLAVQRPQPAAAVPGQLGAGLSGAVPAPASTAARRRLRAGPAGGPRAVHQPEPAAERDDARLGQAVHRDHDRPGRPVRPRGAAVRDLPRARARAVRPCRLPDHAVPS